MSNEQLLGIAVFALAVFALLSGIVVGRLLNDVRRLRTEMIMLNTTKAFASSVSHLPVTVSGGRSQVFAPNTGGSTVGGFTIGTLFSADEAEKLRNLVSPPNGAEPPACSCGELRAELAAARGSQPAPEA